MDEVRRAKLVLDLCAYELKDMPIYDQGTLEAAIASQIKEAVGEALRPYLGPTKEEQNAQMQLRIKKRYNPPSPYSKKK